jgi:hypothetical protein
LAWTRDTTSGVLTHAGTDRDFWKASSGVPATARLFYDGATVAHCIGIMVPTTQDGRTGFRVGIDPADSTKITIRRVTLGVEAAALVTTAHGVPAGVPFRLQIDIISTTITAYVIATGYPTTSAAITNTSAPTYSQFANWGVVSSVDGATVLAAGVIELRAVISEVSEVLIAVCNGNVYRAIDENTIALIEDGGVGAFSPSSDVSLAVLNGTVWGVDGTNARKINVVANKVTAWGPDDVGTNWDILTHGALPGAEDAGGNARKPGTTKAKTVAAHKGRIYMGGMDDAPYAIYASAIGDPQMFWIAEPAEGRAFAIGIDRKPGTSYEILSLQTVTDNVLLIGCTRSIELLIGDPIDGFPERVTASQSTGVSGLNATSTSIGGVNVVHSPDSGLLLVASDGSAPMPISGPVLTELIQFDRGDRSNYAVTVVRDPQRQGTHIFLTLRETSGSVHFWYDERIGGWEPGAGGFFPETYPDAVGPTCAVNWRGYVVMGGKTGFLWKFTEVGSDDGTAISTRMPLAVVNDESVIGDTILTYIRAELSDLSDPVLMRVFGGATVEGAYDLSRREQLFSRTINPYAAPIIHQIRSRALVIEMSSNTIGYEWQLEGVDVDTQIGMLTRRSVKRAAAAAGAKCEFPAVVAPPPPPPPPPPPGPGPGGSGPPPPGPGMPMPNSSFWWQGPEVVPGEGGGGSNPPGGGSGPNEPEPGGPTTPEDNGGGGGAVPANPGGPTFPGGGWGEF